MRWSDPKAISGPASNLAAYSDAPGLCVVGPRALAAPNRKIA